jgi:hypothetical protein
MFNPVQEFISRTHWAATLREIQQEVRDWTLPRNICLVLLEREAIPLVLNIETWMQDKDLFMDNVFLVMISVCSSRV